MHEPPPIIGYGKYSNTSHTQVAEYAEANPSGECVADKIGMLAYSPVVLQSNVPGRMKVFSSWHTAQRRCELGTAAEHDFPFNMAQCRLLSANCKMKQLCLQAGWAALAPLIVQQPLDQTFLTALSHKSHNEGLCTM